MNSYHHPLGTVPDGALAHHVTATPTVIDGRAALSVELARDLADGGLPGVDFVDQPTFLVLPVTFTDGTIDVDLRSRLNSRGLPDSRAFAGIAYRITDTLDRFEAVYLRPLNGRPLNPGTPRDHRAVQHFTYPDWPFARLRDTFPDGRYETGADITPDQWIHLHLDIRGRRCEITINEDAVLTIEHSTAEPTAGVIALFVDTGTRAHFADIMLQR